VASGARPVSGAAVSRDAVAGVELAAMSIPQVLGYARIAGTPPITGFYTLLLPLAAFAVFGSSRFLVVAADSATAAILAGGVAPLAAAAGPRYVALASLVALLTAGMLLLARLVRLGFLADFLSQTVLVGFLTGVGLQVGIAVLGEMLGLTVQSRSTVPQVLELGRHVSDVNMSCLGLSVAVVAGVWILALIAPRFPGPLIAMGAAMAASAAWNFAGHGIDVLGAVAGGVPHLGWPAVTWKDAGALLPVAASCSVMIVTQSAATARIYAARHHQSLDENADLEGLCAANALAAVSGTFVVNGSPTQTGMVESAGGRSQIAHLAAAAVVAVVLLFLTHPLRYLPKCVLGAIVFIVAMRLVDFHGMRGIRQESPGEFWLAAATAAVVVLVGVEQGILLAMVLSLFRIVAHSYHPHTAVLVQGINGLWRLVPAVPGAETEPGLVVYRFGAPLFYANAARFSDEVRALSGIERRKPRWVVVDAGAIARIDYTAARVVRELHHELKECGVTLVFAHVQSDLKPDLERHRLTAVLQPELIFDRLHDALDAYHKLPPNSPGQ